jgi:hypothetical protein
MGQKGRGKTVAATSILAHLHCQTRVICLHNASTYPNTIVQIPSASGSF